MREDHVLIRPATPEDAAAIAAVAASVWPDELLDVAAIQILIATTRRETAVAVLDGVIVGFVDGFLTETEHGEPRWEVDLLAVSPAAQGHGIGRKLVRANIDGGVLAGAASGRALIRIGNVASERVFAACDFAADDVVSQLWISDSFAPPGSHHLHVVPVRTFRYEGIWLEAVTAAGLRALQPGHSGVSGALIPLDDRESLAAAREAGFQPEGEFRFWRRVLTA